ncbi:MAG TPA: hypothetical protein VF234_09920 [Limnochordia bacterium]
MFGRVVITRWSAALFALGILLAPVSAAAPGGAGGLSASKLGIHLIDHYSPGAQRIVAAGPRVIKILGTAPAMMAAVRDYKRRYPDGVVVLRIYTTLRYERGADPVAAAEDFWERGLAPEIAALPPSDRRLIDYLEGPNESEAYPAWESVADAAWYGRFWARLADIMAEHGFRPCVGSIPVGNPPGTLDEIRAKLEAFVPALERAKAHGGAWSYHAYTPDFSTDLAQENWYSVRYRLFYDFLAARHPDLASLPLILTEGGVDHGGDPLADGWQARGTAAAYQRWLRWFDGQLQQDPYVLGVTLFQIGGPYWPSFDLEPISDWLAAYLERGGPVT